MWVVVYRSHMARTDNSNQIPEGAEQLASFLLDELGDDLRSVVWYADREFEYVYARDDVMDEYSDDEIQDVVNDLTMDSLQKPSKERLYAHGTLRSVVECYDDGIEMHFIHDDAEGISIGLEPAAFISHRTFVGKCLEQAQLVED